MTVLIKSAVKFVVDVAVLIGLGLALGRKKRPQYVKLVVSAIILALGLLAYDLSPRWMLGYLFVVPLFVGAAVVLVFFGRMSWKRAVIASVLFIAVHYLVRWFV
jgi:hypothetical protein